MSVGCIIAFVWRYFCTNTADIRKRKVLFYVCMYGGRCKYCIKENGAALASVLTELCVNIVMLAFAQKVIHIDYISRDFITSLMSCALLVVLVKMVNLFVPIHSDLLLLLIEVIVGVVGYLTGLLVLKNSKCYMILKKIHIIK